MKVLITGYSQSLGHVGRCFQLGAELSRKGHTVIFAGSSVFFGKDNLRPPNTEFYPLFEQDNKTLLKRMQRGEYPLKTEDIQQMVNADIQLLKKTKPDLIIQDARSSIRISSAITCIPTVALLCCRWVYPYSKAPYQLSKIESNSVESKSTIKKDKFTDDIGRKARQIRDKSILPIYEKVAQKLGLQPAESYLEYITSDLNLIFDVNWIGNCQNFPNNFHLVGPLIWSPSISLPSWWSDFLALEGYKIYVCFGSTASADLFDIVIDLFRDTPLVNIAIATGGQKNLEGKVASNIFATNLLPGLQVMRACDLTISHGGNLTFYQSLQAGLPIIAIATHQEQEFIAQDVESLKIGFGFVLKEIMSDPNILFDATLKLLDQIAAYKTRVNELQKDLAKYNALKDAVYLIENFF